NFSRTSLIISSREILTIWMCFTRKKFSPTVVNSVNMRFRKTNKIISSGFERENQTTETRLGLSLVRLGIRGWRLHANGLRGRPDFSFRRFNVAVFVDGCFWHGCPKCYRRPASRRKYWDSKVMGNKTRDKRVNRELRKRGWHV